jgi:asparagine synthase (glutamine-hydrolysing)
MSGGRDSTAVFAAGQDALASRGNGQRLHPVSMSFPPGHGGREDEFIQSVAQRWNSPIHWLDGPQISLFADPVQRAACRDEPYEPMYEMITRSLARGSRAAGARIAFDGWGGDQLFELSPVYLADLFRSGRWIALAREWHALGVTDTRYLASTIAPALPRWLRGAATILRRGRPLPQQNQRWIPQWINQRLVPALKQRQLAHLPPRRCGSFASHELYVSLTAATASRVRGWVSGVALDEGVEVRSPLYDARIIELAVTRPDAERRSGRDTKRLLRQAMEGLIPRQVLAPRRHRTGVVGECFRRGMQADYTSLLDAVIGSSVLADLGIIEPAALRRAAADCLSHTWNDDVASALFFTLHTELWLRARVGLDVHDDGRSPAVLPPGEGPGHIQYIGGTSCIRLRSSSASVPSGISR